MSSLVVDGLFRDPQGCPRQYLTNYVEFEQDILQSCVLSCHLYL
jgi:hypothetical protein